MRELLYRHVAHYLLGDRNRKVAEPDHLPVKKEPALRVGLPAESETMQSLTFRRAKQLVAAHTLLEDSQQWTRRKQNMLSRLQREIFGGFPNPAQCKNLLVRRFKHNGYRVEHWTLEPEAGVIVPAVLCLPGPASVDRKRPAVLVVDENGKTKAFQRGLVDRLVSAGNVVLAIDYRGAGETSNTVPSISYGPGTPEYNLSNYALFVGRPLVGMRVFDLRCATDFLAARSEVDAARLSIAGRGRGGFVSVLATALDERIHSVAIEEVLSTWVFEQEFVSVGLSYMIPRIPTIGDMNHLVACVAPRPVLLINPVDGRRRSISVGKSAKQFRFTESVYRNHQAADRFRLRCCDPKQVPALVAEWFQKDG